MQRRSAAQTANAARKQLQQQVAPAQTQRLFTGAERGARLPKLSATPTQDGTQGGARAARPDAIEDAKPRKMGCPDLQPGKAPRKPLQRVENAVNRRHPQERVVAAPAPLSKCSDIFKMRI